MRELLACLWLDAGGYVRVRLACALMLVVASSILSALAPVALKLVVDGLTRTSDASGIARVPAFIALYVASQWLARSAVEARGVIFARAERRVLRSLSERLFAHLMRLPFRFHLERRTGGISQLLDNGLQGCQMILHHLVFTLLPVLAELATIIAVLMHLAQPLFLALFCGALFAYSAAFACAVRTVGPLAERASAASIDSSATMIDGLLCVETVKSFGAESIVQQRVSHALSLTESGWVEFYRRYALNGLGVAAIFALCLATTMAFAAHEVRHGTLSVGGFVLVMTYMLQVVRPVEMLGYAVQGLYQGMALLRRMLELFHERPEPLLGTAEARTEGDTLEFCNVSVSYGSARWILREVSLRIPPGGTLAVVGPSGSGKSTLARLLLRLVDPDQGRVMLGGVPIGNWPLAAWRSLVAVVPQDTVLFNDTIGYNIAFGKSGATAAEIEQAARLAHLHEFVMTLPDRYETPVGERGIKLSGGERQRISIARAAIRRPKIYILDEATSSLDSGTEREILRDLTELSREGTTLIIAHRLSTIVHADEIAVLEDGSIIERGTHTKLLKEKGRYARLWEAQQGSLAA